MGSFRILVAMVAFLSVGSSATEKPLDELKIKCMIAPQYPRLALLAAVSGKVTSTIEAGPDGSVQDVIVESGPALLRDTARQALFRWRLTPCRVDSRRCSLKVTITFELKGRCELPKCSSEVDLMLPATLIIRSEVPDAIVN